MAHSKQAIRQAVLDVLSGREPVSHPITQFRNLEHAVAEIFGRREKEDRNESEFPSVPHLSEPDQATLLEVFWDLFLERVITLGSDPVNYDFPHFRVHSSAKDKL